MNTLGISQLHCAYFRHCRCSIWSSCKTLCNFDAWESRFLIYYICANICSIQEWMLSTRKESSSILVEIRKMMPMDTNDTSVIPVWSIFVWCSFPSQRVSVFPPYLQRCRKLCGVGRGTYAYVFGSFVWTWSSNKVLLGGSNTDVRKSLVWSHLFQNKHIIVFGHVSSLKSNWGAGW